MEEAEYFKSLIKKCKECNLKECISCDYTYTDIIKLENIINKLEQDERVIEEMAEYIVDLIKYINSEETREIKEIIDHFRKKCE